MKRVIAMFLCLILMISVSPTAVLAASESAYTVEADYQNNFDACESIEPLQETIDIEELKTVLFNGFYQCAQFIDISAFHIRNTTANINALSSLIFNEMPACFHIDSYNRWSLSGKITRIEPSYTVSASAYQKMYAEMVSVKDKLLQDIKGNNRLSDAEKALLIHDRLALNCEYDFHNTENMFNCYGALVKGTAVCQGYAEAYDYLLEEVGIESYLCSSDQLNHVWNIVYIDNSSYHVDVTWDDERWDNVERGVVGMVSHENFLRSSDGIYSTSYPHNANDYDTTPNNTTYDNYFWQKSKTAFQLIDDELYYIDNESEELKRYSDNESICSVDDVWKAGAGSYWIGNFACLSSDGQSLFYSLSKAVYKWDLSTKTSVKVFEPELLNTYSIYGFQYSDGYFICDINDKPPGYISNLYQIKELYSVQTPVTVTNIEILSKPAKTVYNLGDLLNTDGLKLKICYSDGETETITNGFTVSGFHSTTSGKKTVTVTYSGLTATFTVLVNDPTKASFADVSNSSWQFTFASYVCQRGLMAGKGTDANGNIKFAPNSPITREEFVQVLYNAESKPTVDMANEFLDVQNSWYTNAVLWAKSKDIANGTPDGNFGVGKNITRQDLAMMLYKYAKLNACSLEANEGEINSYADGSKVAGYAKTAMNWAVTNGILSGKGAAGADISTYRLDPTGTATRAECAAMLKNFMDAFGV